MTEVAVFVQTHAAVVAETRAEMVLLPAAIAVIGKFAGRHGQKQAVGSFDQLHVSDDERVVERQRAKSLESIVLPLNQIDAYLSELHNSTLK